MKTYILKTLIFALSVQSQVIARDVTVHVPDSAKSMKFDEVVRLADQDCSLSINGSMSQNHGGQSVSANVQYSVIMNGKRVTQGSINQTAVFTSMAEDLSDGPKVFGTMFKNDGPWITMVKFVPRQIKGTDLVEYTQFVILGMGEFGSGKSLVDEAIFDPDKNIQIIKNKFGSAAIIKTGAIFLK